MSILKQVRRGHLVALGTAVLVVLLALAWGHSGAGQVGAHEPHPGLDLSIAVPEAVGDCDTTGGDMKCLVPVGTTFTVVVSLDALPGDVASYAGYDASLTYSGVTSKDNASFDGDDDWPDCVFGAASYGEGTVLFGCATGIGAAPSTYTGRLGSNDFNCTEDETEENTVVLVHGAASGDTSITDPQGAQHAEAGTETLTINCLIPPPTPTPTITATPTATTEVPEATPTGEGLPTALPPTGVGSDADGGVGAGLWTVIGTLLAAATAGLAVIGWRRYARSS